MKIVWMVDGRCRRLPRAATGLLLSASLLPLAAATSASIVGRRGAQSSYPGQEQLVGKPLKRLAYHFLHRSCSRGEVLQPRVAVFMIGLPGSGKSRVIDYRYALSFATRRPDNHTIVLDLDAEAVHGPARAPLLGKYGQSRKIVQASTLKIHSIMCPLTGSIF